MSTSIRQPASSLRLLVASVALCAVSTACSPAAEDGIAQHDATVSAGETTFDAEMAGPPPAHARDAAQAPAEPKDAQSTADAAAPAEAVAPLAPDAGDASVASDAGERDAAGDAAPAPPCLAMGSGDYSRRGPYGVKRDTVEVPPVAGSSRTSNPHTIFAPEPLEVACPHPVAAWANGTAVVGTDTYAFFQENAASWGIVVIASHSDSADLNEHERAIDYMLAQNADPSSRFYRKLSGRAGAAGHAQGASIATSSGGRHSNIEAIIAISPNGIGEMGTRAFLCLTGTNDLAPENCRIEVSQAEGPAFEAIWEGADRPVTPTIAGFMSGDPGTLQMMRLYAAWYRCFLAGDARACGLFRGGQACGLCDEAGWAELVSNNL